MSKNIVEKGNEFSLSGKSVTYIEKKKARKNSMVSNWNWKYQYKLMILNVCLNTMKFKYYVSICVLS